MAKYRSYIECIFISSEVVSFRIEMYDNETREMVAKINDMVNRRTRKGSINWITKNNDNLAHELLNKIHEDCLKRMEDVGI